MIMQQLNFLRHLVLDPDFIVAGVIALAAAVDNFGELGIALNNVLLDAVYLVLCLLKFLGQGFVNPALVFEFGLHLLELEVDSEDDGLFLDLTGL